LTFYHTNLIPHVYELDDFQVRTPTDIMGQHIHLVKFDVTSSDGAGNGYNYEDGTFSPGEVLERIHAINAAGGLQAFNSTAKTQLTARAHPFFGTVGAQTTVQRWFADPTLNLVGKDRTLGTVFSHDHFGPSTHQQNGLYSGLVTEPENSVWKHNETGQALGGRFDGGPTTWQAVIQTANTADSYREFLLEFADYTLAYKAGGGVDGAGNAVPDPENVINPPVRDEAALPINIQKAAQCPGGVPLPCPEAVSAADPGTMVVNYRNEPVALRSQDPSTNTQAAGDAGDLSNVYRSDVTRANNALNQQPNFYPPLTGGLQGGDLRCCVRMKLTRCRYAFSSARTRKVTTLVSTDRSGSTSVQTRIRDTAIRSRWASRSTSSLNCRVSLRSRAALRLWITCISRAVPWITSGTVPGVCCVPIVALLVSSPICSYFQATRPAWRRLPTTRETSMVLVRWLRRAASSA
jgi:hypothetical protein